MLTKNEIIEAINIAIEATEASKVGPLRTGEVDSNGNPVFSNLAWQTYLNVLAKVLPASLDAKFECEHGEQSTAKMEVG